MKTGGMDIWVKSRRQNTESGWIPARYVHSIALCIAQAQHQNSLLQRRYSTCFRIMLFSQLIQSRPAPSSMHLITMAHWDFSFTNAMSRRWYSRIRTSFQGGTNVSIPVEKPGSSQHEIPIQDIGRLRLMRTTDRKRSSPVDTESSNLCESQSAWKTHWQHFNKLWTSSYLQ